MQNHDSPKQGGGGGGGGGWQEYSTLAHTKNDSRRIILTQAMSDHIIETTSLTPQ